MMSCECCGTRCQGRRCAGCAQIETNEARYGVPADYDDSDWQVEQQGLDGEFRGQATLDGGVAKDGSER